MKNVIYFLITCALSFEPVFSGVVLQKNLLINSCFTAGIWCLFCYGVNKRSKRKQFEGEEKFKNY